MTTNSNSLIKSEVDRLFAELNAKPDGCCRNPITDGGFVKGLDPIAEQKEYANIALLAREWFAVNGPPNAPLLPLNVNDRDRFRGSGGLTALIGFYARSLSRQRYDVFKHPPFDEFARGLMAIATERGLWGLENDQSLMRRFPPRPLVGMMPSAYWDPHEYAELQRRGAALGSLCNRGDVKLLDAENKCHFLNYEKSAWQLIVPPIHGWHLCSVFVARSSLTAKSG